MRSKATTVAAYLAEQPPERRSALAAVRKAILANLDHDYEEGMQYGMIGYYVPHRVFPAGYHCDPKQPLPFASLASQKGFMALYLMSVYADGEHQRWFREAWARSGKKLAMGKACVRFKELDDVPLDGIGEGIRRVPAQKYVDLYLAARAGTRSASGKGAPAKKAPAKKAPAKKAAGGAKKPARRA